jgi:predicted short-subunit dehydrogenase-like oxidoreductase (DUF2520 family)
LIILFITGLFSFFSSREDIEAAEDQLLYALNEFHKEIVKEVLREVEGKYGN